MTYLDPDQMRTTVHWRQWALRIAGIAAIVAVAWMALTLGSDNGSVRPEIVDEPTAEAASAPQ